MSDGPKTERQEFGAWLVSLREEADLRQAEVLRAMNALPNLAEKDKKSRSYLARVETGKMVPSRSASMQIGAALQALDVDITGEAIWERAAPLAAADPVRDFYEAQITVLKDLLTSRKSAMVEDVSAAEWDMLAALRRLNDVLDPEWLPAGQVRPRSHVHATPPEVPPWLLAESSPEDVAAFVAHHLADALRNADRVTNRERLLMRLVQIITSEANYGELFAWLEASVAVWESASADNALALRRNFLEETQLQHALLAMKRGGRPAPSPVMERLDSYARRPTGDRRLLGDAVLESLFEAYGDESEE